MIKTLPQSLRLACQERRYLQALFHLTILIQPTHIWSGIYWPNISHKNQYRLNWKPLSAHFDNCCTHCFDSMSQNVATHKWKMVVMWLMVLWCSEGIFRLIIFQLTKINPFNIPHSTTFKENCIDCVQFVLSFNV